MRGLRYSIIALFLTATHLLPAQTHVSDSVKIEAMEHGDSLELRVTAYQIETQLTFLMQGLDILVIQPDTFLVSFPSARMVRSKMRRHPNEVKAELAPRNGQKTGLDSVNHVIRPDVQPLVAALNDTTASFNYKGMRVPSRDFKIEVDREKAIMTFTVKLEKSAVQKHDDIVHLLVSSVPLGNKSDRQEFAGMRLSGENAPRPNGLGWGMRKEDVSKRTFQKEFSVKAETVDEE